jgi:hypothetical protein
MAECLIVVDSQKDWKTVLVSSRESSILIVVRTSRSGSWLERVEEGAEGSHFYFFGA